VRELEAALAGGPAARGGEDQCWTLARIAEVVRRRFGVEYNLAGLDLLAPAGLPSSCSSRAHCRGPSGSSDTGPLDRNAPAIAAPTLR